MNKEDKEYLLKVLNYSHEYENGCDINKCGHTNCWYKKKVKELKLGARNKEKEQHGK